MFITQNNDKVFIRSQHVNVFPCGRRRSTPVAKENPDDFYYIPFDPEARLNTEANNLKHTGLNGFANTYVYDWDETTGLLQIVLGGYFFEIQLLENYRTPDEFASGLNDLTNNGFINKIFVNIGIEGVQLFASSANLPAHTTKVLRDLTSNINSTNGSLDLLIENQSSSEPKNYYFSGLSITPTAATDKGIVSLQLLEKIDNKWQIHNKSRLPVIEHGSSENSIKVGTIEAESVLVGQGKVPAASLEIKETSKGSGIWQLQFSTNR